MSHKIGGLDRPTMPGNVAWACANDPCEIGDLARDQSGVVELPRAKCNGHVFADDTDKAIRQEEIECDLRVARQKVRQCRSKFVDRKGRKGMHAQMTTRQ